VKTLTLALLLTVAAACHRDPGVELRTPNGSTDGRYHTCGYVTEDGVTDHLAEYAKRCPEVAP
jgi:hypothetical protein